jgi:cytochrome P450
MEISVTLAELLQRFTFTEAEPDKPLKTENYWFVKQKDLMYRVSLK